MALAKRLGEACEFGLGALCFVAMLGSMSFLRPTCYPMIHRVTTPTTFMVEPLEGVAALVASASVFALLWLLRWRGRLSLARAAVGFVPLFSLGLMAVEARWAGLACYLLILALTLSSSARRVRCVAVGFIAAYGVLEALSLVYWVLKAFIPNPPLGEVAYVSYLLSYLWTPLTVPVALAAIYWVVLRPLARLYVSSLKSLRRPRKEEA